MREFASVFKKRDCNWRVRSVLVLLALLISCGSANAFNIPTGNDEVWQLKFDNTFRYFLQYRIASQNDAILANINGDDGDRNFDKGIVSNRLDILTELDLVNKEKQYGIRFSGAFWRDQQYHNRFDNNSVATSNLFVDGVQSVNGLYKFADRYYSGPYGELLDAFIFGQVSIGDVPVYLKLGRHIYSWGQSLLDPFHGISYGQMPLDLGKAQAMPGVEAKEVFRPLNNFSVVAQLTNEFQLAAQYFLQWERNKLPEAQTYFGSSDICLDGSGTLLFAPGGGPGTYMTHGRDIEAARGRDFGIAAQWTPMSLADTTFGLYYRRFSDKMPTVILNLGDMTYHAAYKSNIDLFGFSYATTYAGTSIGAEVSYRRNMTLNGGTAMIMSSAQLPDDGDILGPTGDVMFGLVNFLGLLKKSSLWDAGSWMVEFDYARWMSVGDDPQHLFAGADGYAGFNRVTRDSGDIIIVVTPQYLQIYPGLDLSVPVSLNYGLFGVGPCAANNGEGDGNFAVGLNFQYLTKYNLNFTYSNFFGKLGDGASARGNYALYRDRDFISMTFKVSF